MFFSKPVHPFADSNPVFGEKGSTPHSKPNSSLKCTLFVLLMLLGSAVVLFPLMLLGRGGSPNGRVIGESHGFIKASVLIQESLNTSANPCEDFYEYVCGNYPKNNLLRPGQRAVSEMRKLDRKTDNQLLDLLQSHANSTSQAISKVKIIYNSCVLESAYVNKTPSVALEEIKSVGHWPLLMGESYGDIDVQDILEKVENIGISNIFKLDVTRDIKNRSRIALAFVEGEPLFPWEAYQDDAGEDAIKIIKDRVRKRIKQFAKDTGYPENPNFESELRDMFEFDSSVGKLIRDPEEYISPEATYNVKTFDEFSGWMKQQAGIDLKKIVLASIPEYARGLITPDTIIMVADPDFANNIVRVIRNVKPKVFVNYLMYRIMSNYNGFYGQEYRDIDEEMNEKLHLGKEEYSTWPKCKKIAMVMQKAVGALFARKHFDQESKEMILEMIQNLKEAFIEMVDENEWMDEETKKAAKLKAQEMTPHIGYNKLAFDDEKLDEYYKDVDVSDFKDFHVMYAKLADWAKDNYFKGLVNPRNRHEFFDVASTVNAMFSPSRNAILFPAAILQFPLFKRDQPQSLNYGSIGSIIGHEITHGFDNNGKDYDEMGNLRDWWAKETAKKFEEKSKCIVNQYSSVEVPGTEGMHIDGEMTLGENIADNGGIREAFRAYKKHVSRHGTEPRLPGVPLNDDQLFFVGYANNYCATVTPEKLIDQIQTDEHSPYRYRTNLVMQNSRKFSEVFKCPVGSPMNPEKKCRIW